MEKLRSLTVTAAVAAALGLVSVASAQTPAPQTPGDAQSPQQTVPGPDPSAASSPHQRDVTTKPGTETEPTQSPEPDAASTPHQHGALGDTPAAGMTAGPSKLVGLEVQSPSGQALGTVIDVVASNTGEPGYVVISTGTDTATAVPYASVSPMIKGGKVIMDRTRLQNSPQVAQSDLHDKANTKWRQQADTYWSGQIRSASPGTDTSQMPKER